MKIFSGLSTLALPNASSLLFCFRVVFGEYQYNPNLKIQIRVSNTTSSCEASNACATAAHVKPVSTLVLKTTFLLAMMKIFKIVGNCWWNERTEECRFSQFAMSPLFADDFLTWCQHIKKNTLFQKISSRLHQPKQSWGLFRRCRHLF